MIATYSTLIWQEYYGWYYWSPDGEKLGPFWSREMAIDNLLYNLKARRTT